MKLLIILFMIILAVVLITAVLYSLTKADTPVKKNVQNYKVRFDAANEKYFIVNQLETYDEPVTNWLGVRVMYKDKPKAEFVCEKLNA